MTKEQEEAIKYFENEIKVHREQIDKLKEEGQFEGNGTMIDIYKLRICMITIILNMLKEKDTEIEKYKNLLASNLAKNLNDSIKAKEKANTDLEDLNEGWKLELKKKNEELEMYKDIKEIANSKVTELVKLKQYDDLKEENRKKDKMIDLMAEHICSSAVVDDTVCAIKCDCKTDINEDCTHEKMLNCTKQYFERKATNDG